MATTSATFLPSLVRVARWLSCMLTIWLGAMLLSFEARAYSRIVLLQFATGSSWAKPLIIVAILLLFTLLLSIPVRPAAPKRQMFWGVLGVAAVLPVVAHFWFSWKLGLSIFSRTISFIDGEVSTNELIHIHVGKGALFSFLRAVGGDWVTSFSDPGAVFANLLPAPLLFLGILIIPYAGWLLYAKLVQLSRIWDSSNRLILTFPYLICATVFLKACIDGGPFDSQAMVAIPVLYSLVAFSNQPWKVFFVRSISLVIAGLGTSSVMFVLCGSRYWRGLPASLAFYFWMISLVMIVGVLWIREMRTVRSVLLLMMHLIIPISLLPHSYKPMEFLRMRQALEPGETILMREKAPFVRNLPVWGEDGDLRFYQIEVTHESRVVEYYKQFNFSPGFASFIRVDHDCSIQDSYVREADLHVVDGDLIPHVALPHFLRDFKATRCDSSESCSYHLQSKQKGCTPDEVYDVMINYLTQHGVKVGVLVQTQELVTPPPWPEWLKF